MFPDRSFEQYVIERHQELIDEATARRKFKRTQSRQPVKPRLLKVTLAALLTIKRTG